MHDYSIKEAMSSLKTSEKGLTSAEAARRLGKYGRNEIKKKDGVSALRIFLRQFKDPVIYILLAAIGLSFFVREFANSAVIGVIVVFNAIFGFVQEYRAEKAIELLRQFETKKAKVLRDGIEVSIDAAELVPGDLIIIEAGDKIPADARIIWDLALRANESILTGESEPVTKTVKALPVKTSLADRRNMVFEGTVVVDGRAKAVVTATNENTEIGKIAKLVKETGETETPLQLRLRKLGKWMTVFAIAAASLVVSMSLAKGLPVYDAMMLTISLAVSAIPEGLPVVVTICLALGVRRMVKRKAIIKRLKSVETLGSVTVICSDKTGTITKNEMTVTEIFDNNDIIQVTGSGYSTKGDFLLNKKSINPDRISEVLRAGVLCNNATLHTGDPTEIALLVVAEKAGIKVVEERIGEVPFTPERKYMLANYKGLVCVKGAPERVIRMCSHILVGGRKLKMSSKEASRLIEVNDGMASRALRVLAVASGKSEKDLTFLGFVGMIDSPRAGVKEAVHLCKAAGIRPVMITGDHKLTALAIAKEVGIRGGAILGEEIDELTDKELTSVVRDVSVFCRTTSVHKVRILEALQRNDEVVAMTGDGVNDAPALKKADVGVAMNVSGTDLSKEVADIVLVDDNFASIVHAVREGRTIYDNIKKFVTFLLSANFDEMALVLTAVLFSLPIPLLPVQILWINLITESFPALALGADGASKDIMQRKPRPVKESLFNGTRFFLVSAILLAFIVSISTFVVGLRSGSIDRARTLVFTAVIIMETFIAFGVRSGSSILRFSPFTNKWLIGASLFAMVLNLVAVYSPLNVYLGLVPLTLLEVIAVFGFAFSAFLILELGKLVISFYKND